MEQCAKRHVEAQGGALEDEGEPAGASASKRARTALLDSDEEDGAPVEHPSAVRLCHSCLDLAWPCDGCGRLLGFAASWERVTIDLLCTPPH